MDRPGALCRMFITVLLVGQISGTPIFWNQPDCDQSLSYPSSGYTDYQQGPSYHEMLQEMVHDTLVALRDIFIITAQVTRQELEAVVKMLYNKAQCNNSVESGYGQFNNEHGQSVEFHKESYNNNQIQNSNNHDNLPMFETQNKIRDSYTNSEKENELLNINLNKQHFDDEIQNSSTEKLTTLNGSTTLYEEETSLPTEETSTVNVMTTVSTTL